MSETQKKKHSFQNQQNTKHKSEKFTAAKRIFVSVRNGLAVVCIERGASAGSFFTIPQIQSRNCCKKKIITDEHSGRILVDAALADEERENGTTFKILYHQNHVKSVVLFKTQNHIVHLSKPNLLKII
jgi:hypothetical protein